MPRDPCSTFPEPLTNVHFILQNRDTDDGGKRNINHDSGGEGGGGEKSFVGPRRTELSPLYLFSLLFCLLTVPQGIRFTTRSEEGYVIEDNKSVDSIL